MVAIVEGVAEVGVEGVDVGEAGEVGEHFGEAFGDCLLGEFDFSHAASLEMGLCIFVWVLVGRSGTFNGKRLSRNKFDYKYHQSAMGNVLIE